MLVNARSAVEGIAPEERDNLAKISEILYSTDVRVDANLTRRASRITGTASLIIDRMALSCPKTAYTRVQMSMRWKGRRRPFSERCALRLGPTRSLL